MKKRIKKIQQKKSNPDIEQAVNVAIKAIRAATQEITDEPQPDLNWVWVNLNEANNQIRKVKTQAE